MYVHVSKALKATNLDYKELFYWYAIIKDFTSVSIILRVKPNIILYYSVKYIQEF